MIPLNPPPSLGRSVQSLSVVIPALNEEASIATAVAAAWDLGPREVIVSDGGSSDTTREIAASLGATVLESARGRGRQLNAGARGATGDVLLFQHADTWLTAAAADQLAGVLRDQRVLWGAFRQAIDGVERRYRALEWGNAFRARRLGLPYGDQGMFVRRETFDQVGGFPDQPLMEDVELSQRLRRLARPVLLDGPLHISARRWREQGVVRQTLRNWALLATWRLGAPPVKLAKWYRPHSPTAAQQEGRDEAQGVVAHRSGPSKQESR